MIDKNSKSIVVGILSSIGASLCCVTPVLALISGSSGIASTFSWLEPFRPWLIGLTITVIAFAWYQKLKPRTKEEIACACNENQTSSFWQSKRLLGIVTVFAVVMLAFPYYADIFYPQSKLSASKEMNTASPYQIKINGMTCSGCEKHVKHEIGKLPGISVLEVSYKKGNAKVAFDESKTNLTDIKSAVGKTGYKIESINRAK